MCENGRPLLTFEHGTLTTISWDVATLYSMEGVVLATAVVLALVTFELGTIFAYGLM
jgi:glycerol kinase